MATKNYISWNDYFMAQACLSARRSKDPNTQVGSSLVGEDNRIIGLGWNVFQHDPSGSIGDLEREAPHPLDTKYPYVMHSDLHAVINKSAVSLKNYKMYTMMYPTALSTKILVQSGIKKLVYLSSAKNYHDERSMTSSEMMLENEEVDESYSLKDEDYFMYVACLASKRSKDPNRQVGACIVKPGQGGGRSHIVGIGYNGWPKGEERYPWDGGEDEHDPNTKYPYVVHAEVNAILYKTTADLSGCTLYVTLSPCNQCATAIIESGITEVLILNDKNKDKNTAFRAGRALLDKKLGGKNRVFDIKNRQKLTIDFKELRESLDAKRPPSTAPKPSTAPEPSTAP